MSHLNSLLAILTLKAVADEGGYSGDMGMIRLRVQAMIDDASAVVELNTLVEMAAILDESALGDEGEELGDASENDTD